MPDINLAPTNYELEAIQKRRKMAELLIQQAQQPMDMPQVAGARISPVAGLAKLLKAYTGSQNLKKSEEEEKQYQSDYLSDLGFLMRNAGKSTPATEAIPEQTENITTPNIANQNLQEVALRQSTMRDPNAAINPFERQMGVDERAQVAKLPLQTVEERVTPAVPAMAGSPLLSADLLSGNNANGYIKTGAGKMALAQYLMQQQAQQQAATLESQKVKSRNPEEELYRYSDGKYEVVSAGKPKADFGQPITEFDPANGKTLTVVYDKGGNRKVINTNGAYTPNQWNSMPLADKAKILFDQYKFGNLSAEQIQQARQKDAQLDQEMVKIGFDTGMKVQGGIGVSNNAPMPNLVEALTKPVAAPAVVSVPAPTTVQPVVTPIRKQPYTPLNQVQNAPSSAPPAPSDQAASQPPAGLSPKAKQQWIIENSKKQMDISAESAKTKPQEKLSAETALTNLTRMKNVAEELRGHKGLDSIVGKWNQYSIFDTSDNAINARALQGTLVKQSATAALQAMRDASKTGGAVGGVSEKEWPILEQQIAALDSAQTPKAYRIALQNLQSQLDSSISNITQAYESKHGKLEFTPPKYYKQDEAQTGWKVVE
jgi:hypothetical protein